MRPVARAAVPAVILTLAALLQAAPANAGHQRTPIHVRAVGRDPYPASGETIGRPLLSNISASRLTRLHRSAPRSGTATRRTTTGPRTPNVVTQFAGPTAGVAPNPLASPSDSSGAIGSDFIVGTVNVVVQVYDTSGATQAGPFRLKNLFSGLTGTDTDPKVIYDPYHDEFVLAFLMFTSSSSQIVVVEIPGATADMKSTWCAVVLNGDQISRNGSQVADYTQLGFSANRVTIDTNNYQASTLSYAYVQMLSFSSTQLYDCQNDNPAYKVFGGKQTRNPDGSKAFTIQPAETATDLGSQPTTQFLTSFEWRGNTHPSRMVVWRLRKNSRGKLILTNTAVNVGVVHIPPFGTQCGGSSSLDTKWDPGDTRLVNAYYDADRQRLYTAHAVKHDFGGGNASAVRWYEIHPAGTLKNSTVLRKGFIGEDGSDAGWPSIADNADGVVFVNYNQASASNGECIGVWAATIQTGSTTPSEVEIKSSAYRYDFSSGVERWGDYTQLNRDPSDTTRMGMFNAYTFPDGTPTTTLQFQEWIFVANDV